MSKKAMTLALEALEGSIAITMAKIDLRNTAIKALEEALAKQDQGEPVAWMSEENECIFFDADKPNPMNYDFWTPLYTTPQPAQKPLTDEQILRLLSRIDECAVRLPRGLREFARAIEAAHGIKENT